MPHVLTIWGLHYITSSMVIICAHQIIRCAPIGYLDCLVNTKSFGVH